MTIVNYFLNGCHDFTPEVIEYLRPEVNRVNTDGTIDGIIYDSPTNAIRLINNGCDKKPDLIVKKAPKGRRKPSGKKFGRFFKIQNAAPEAFVGGGTVIVVVNQTDSTYTSDDVRVNQTSGATVVSGDIVKGKTTLPNVNDSLTGTNDTNVLIQHGQATR
jgi:hypothetical protein